MDIKKGAQGKNDNCKSNFFKLTHEHKRIGQIEKESASAEGFRIRFQEDSSAICKELRECKLNEILEQTRRQQLRASSHELRQLEKQLRSALATKQLREQQKFLSEQKTEELRKNREENAKFAAECEFLRKSILQEEEKAIRKKEVFRSTLKSQIKELQLRRRIEFEDVVKDQDDMNNLLKRIHAEEIAEQRQADQYREKCRKEMEDSIHNKEQQRKLEKERNVDDTERYLTYQKERDRLISQREEERKRILNEKEALSERIARQLATVHQEKENRKEALLSLLVEERKAKEDKLHREMLIKRIQEREKLRNEMENHRYEAKIQKEKQFKEEEEKFREQHLRYLAERDKLEQLSDEKRRRKKLEHSKALREMIEIRRSQRAKEIADRIADFEKILCGEKEKDRLIEEERIKMLSSMPKEILSYLPPGVLRSSDKEFFTLPGHTT